MKKGFKTLIFFMILVLLFSTAVAAAGHKEGGILNVANFQTPMKLDPHGPMPQTTIVTMGQIYEGLVTFSEEMEIKAVLAEDWEQVDDTTFIFNIRKGVKWHNGDDLTIEDVVYSLNRMKDPEVSFRASYFEVIEEVTALDDYTVEIKLSKPFAPFLTKLASPYASIVNKSVIENAPEGPETLETIVGTGPFKLTRYQPQQKVEMRKFDNYWEEGVPYLDGINMTFLPDESVRVSNLEAGAVDWINFVPAQAMEDLKDDSDIKVYHNPAGLYYWLGMNTLKPPFDHPLVREALGWVMDREAMTEVVAFGFGTAIKGDPQPEATWSYTGYEYFDEIDVEKGKELMEKAGYGNGTSATIGFYAGAPDEGVMAEIVQMQAKKIGLNLEIEAIEEAVWRERVDNQEYDIIVTGGFDFTPDDYFYTRLHSNGSGNWWGFSSEKLDKLAEEGRSIYDKDERKEIYLEFLKTMYEDVKPPMLYISRIENRTATLDYVKGYSQLPDGTATNLKYTWLDE